MLIVNRKCNQKITKEGASYKLAINTINTRNLAS